MRCNAIILLFFYSICLIPNSGITQEDVRDIRDISLDELLNIPISTAAKYEQRIGEAPASIAIITSEDIDRYDYRTLNEVFMSVRGFYESYDRNYTYMGIRGFGRPTDYNNRILLLVNGHALNNRLYGSAFIGTTFGLDLDSIERIEIVRGPGSALYGTNAMLAVVNVITKKGTAMEGVDVSVVMGSYGRLQGKAALGKEFDNGLDIFVSGLWGDIKGQDRLYYEEYDDPSTNNGFAEDLDWDKHYGALATLAYHSFTLQGAITSREKGMPTGAWGMLFNDADAGTLDERQFIEGQYDHDISADKNIMLKGYFDRHFYQGTYPYEDNWSDESDNIWLAGEIRFRWDIRPDNRLIVGSEYQNHFRADYRYRYVEDTLFDDDFPHNILSFYLQDEHQATEDLSVTFGIRWDEYSTTGSSTNPRAAIIYNPIRSGTLKLLYGEAFRAPSVYEANYEEMDYWEGNPDLKSEKIRTAEVVWEQRLSDELFGTVSVYSYKMSDLIDTVELPSSLFQYQNLTKVRTSGLELELNARLKMGLWGYANYSFQNAEHADSKEKLTNSPRHIMKIGSSCPIFRHFYAAAELQYETDRITVYGTKTDSYLLTRINLSTKQLFNHISVSLLVRNLFDIEYRLPGGFEHIQHAITQDGRNFGVKLTSEF